MKADAIQEILKDLNTVFGNITDLNYYNEIAPETASYPLITYELDNSFSDGAATEVMIMYIDGWDLFSREPSGTVELEAMIASVIQSLYRRKVQVSPELCFWYALDSRRWIRDAEDDIRHRRLMYQVRTFGKE